MAFRKTPPTGVINRLDHRGHGPVAQWAAGDRLSETEAQRIFAEHQGNRFTMFNISDGQDGELMKAFDPAATEILAVPRMQAG